MSNNSFKLQTHLVSESIVFITALIFLLIMGKSLGENLTELFITINNYYTDIITDIFILKYIYFYFTKKNIQ